jgi:KDO2-lipid IV(A) lauroyltransferase
LVVGESILKDIGRIFIWFFLRHLILILPPPIEIKVNAILGRIFYCLSRKKKEVVKQNLIAVFGKRSDIDQLARLNFENHFIDQYLIFSFPKLRAENISRYVTFEGLEHLDEALKTGRGVIIIHGHLGPRLLSTFALGLIGYKMNQIEGPIIEGLSFLGRYCARQKICLERKIPANFINVQKFMRPVFNAIKRNECVMISGDGMGAKKFTGRQYAVTFLGHKVKFPGGPVSLAARTGAILMPLFTVNSGLDEKYQVIIGEQISVIYGQIGESELIRNLEKFVTIFEKEVIRYPHLWHFWDEFFYRTSDCENNVIKR